ncbi:MAG: RNA polymerase sigma factor [Eubacterium sp.]|nr:RNA polymerase sigma factor [Eubacterium sp.]
MGKCSFNETEFNEKYDKYCNLIYRTAYQYVFNIQLAEDVMQEAFVKLLTCDKHFQNDEHEKAWLLRVAINLCKNILKSKAYQNLELKNETSPIESTFEENADNKIAITNYLKRLNSEQRTAIFLYYFEGFRIKEIAKIMKMKENTVKSHLKRAKQNLKMNIEKEQENGLF